MRACTKCGIEKEDSGFYKKKDGKFGTTRICKKCNSSYDKTRRTKKYFDEWNNFEDFMSYANFKMQNAARRLLSLALTKDWLVQNKQCWSCKKKRSTIAFQPDFSRPMFVIWMCESCVNQYKAKREISSDLLFDYLESLCPGYSKSNIPPCHPEIQPT